MGLRAEYPRGGTAECAVVGEGVEVLLAVRVGGQHDEPGVAYGRDHGGRIIRAYDVEVEQTAGRRPDRLPVVRVDRLAREDHGIGPSGIGRPEHRTGVTRIADSDEHGDQPWPRL
jgi:hypothetical protein